MLLYYQNKKLSVQQFSNEEEIEKIVIYNPVHKRLKLIILLFV